MQAFAVCTHNDPLRGVVSSPFWGDEILAWGARGRLVTGRDEITPTNSQRLAEMQAFAVL